METINVFGKTYQVSKQAKYSYYSSLIIITIVLLKAYKMKSKTKPLYLMILITAACISPYATNCVSTGQKCEEYGWYLSISNMIVASTLLLSFMKPKSKI